jgi:hypothetical protein
LFVCCALACFQLLQISLLPLLTEPPNRPVSRPTTLEHTTNTGLPTSLNAQAKTHVNKSTCLFICTCNTCWPAIVDRLLSTPATVKRGPSPNNDDDNYYYYYWANASVICRLDTSGGSEGTVCWIVLHLSAV